MTAPAATMSALEGFEETIESTMKDWTIAGASILAIKDGDVVFSKGFGFREIRAVRIIDPEVERVVGHHAEHQPVAEYAGLAEHTPHGDVAERAQLIAQKVGKAVAGNHRRSLVLSLAVSARRIDRLIGPA